MLEPPETTSLVAPETRLAPTTTEGADPTSSAFTMLSEQKREGPWSPAWHNEFTSVVGSTIIDLREALLPRGTVEIELKAFMAETQIIIPPGLQVTIDCSTVLAEIEQDEPFVDVDPLPTRLKVTGTVVLGHVVIRERLRGETRRDARRRRRTERRALKQARKRGRHAIPPGPA